MKVCLIIPSSLILSDDRVIPHLGILKVASSLRAHGVEVDVLDVSGVTNYEETIAAYCARNDTGIFGLTATSPQLPTSGKIAESIRRERPDAKLILGGPHGTLVNAAYRKEKGRGGRATRALERIFDYFDVLVAGDGEFAVFEALKENCGRIIDADSINSDLFLKSGQLTSLPFPARDLIDLASYHYEIDKVPTTSIIAQLGCPFGCGFCGGRNTAFLRKIRLRTTESVVAEMRHIFAQYGFRGIMFYDDELNVNKQMIPLMHAIRDLEKELGIEWRLRGFVKAELFTDDQAEAMYETGFREILTGFESGSPRILLNINKHATLEDNMRCVAIARRHGLRVKALMSIGHPGETVDTIRETKEFVLATAPESFDLTRITVYAGTPYYDDATPHETEEGVWTYRAPATKDRLYSKEIDCFEKPVFYKGDRGERMGFKEFFAYTDTLSANDLALLRDQTEAEIRGTLKQEYQKDAPGIRFDSSMGQFPGYILRSTAKA